MKPKEPPRVCGTCGGWIEIPLMDEDIEVGERISVCQCCWMVDMSRESRPLFGGLEPGDCFCDGKFWTSRTDDPNPGCDDCPERLPEDACKVKARCYDLQERCQQLEQVALDIFKHMQGLDDILRKNAHDEYMRTVGKAVIGDIADRLEALGVDTDD